MFLKDSIQHLQDETIRVAGGHKDRLAVLKAENRRQEIEIENAESRYKGKRWKETVDDTAGAVKAVPAASFPVARLEGWAGKSVVWNQLCSGNGEEASKTLSGSNYENISRPWVDISGKRYGFKDGHYYLVFAEFKTDNIEIPYQIGITDSKVYTGLKNFKAATTNWAEYRCVVKMVGNTPDGFLGYSFVRKGNSSESPNASARNQFTVDLTQLLGAGNEPTSEDDPRIQAIEEFMKKSPGFNPGQILSADATGILSKGRNLFEFDNVFYNASFAYIYASNGEIKAKGNSAASAYVGLGNKIKSGKYTFSWKSNNRNVYVVIGASDGADIKVDGTISNSVLAIRLFFNTEFGGYKYIESDRCSIESNVDFFVGFAFSDRDYELHDIQLEESNFATEYTPYWERLKPVLDFIRALPGYGLSAGSAANRIIRRNGRVIYRQEVGEFDLGDFVWSYGWLGWFSADFKAGSSARLANPAAFPNLVCAKYDVTQAQANNTGISLVYGGADYPSNGHIWCGDPSIENAADAKAKLTGVKVVVELETPIETDITDMIPADWPYLDVEAGGTVEFVMDHGLKLPLESTITYQEKL